jgi:hypothetical protein
LSKRKEKRWKEHKMEAYAGMDIPNAGYVLQSAKF